MVQPIDLAAASREATLTLRRVERHQRLVEIVAASSERLSLDRLAADLGVAVRTVGRDVARLVDSGVPLDVRRGPHGGVSLPATVRAEYVLRLTFAEVAALLASLVNVGPTVSASSASATARLVASLAEVG